MDTFTAAAKAVLMEVEAAGINACSTPQGTQRMGIKNGMNACSTPLQKHQRWELADSAAVAKAQILKGLYAAASLCSPLPEGKGWGRSSTVGVR
jgi:hypothetical protein